MRKSEYLTKKASNGIQNIYVRWVTRTVRSRKHHVIDSCTDHVGRNAAQQSHPLLSLVSKPGQPSQPLFVNIAWTLGPSVSISYVVFVTYFFLNFRIVIF